MLSNNGSSNNINSHDINDINSFENFNNSKNNSNNEQKMIINSSYKKKSPRNANNPINKESSTQKENQNIISIYIKMNNKNKNSDSNKIIENNIEFQKERQEKNDNINIRENKQNISDLKNNNNIKEYFNEKKYSNTLRESHKSSRKNITNPQKNIIKILNIKFESLLKREKILINTEKYIKFKNYFSKMIISPYLSKISP